MGTDVHAYLRVRSIGVLFHKPKAIIKVSPVDTPVDGVQQNSDVETGDAARTGRRHDASIHL